MNIDKRLDKIDVLRGIAIIAVFIYHFEGIIYLWKNHFENFKGFFVDFEKENNLIIKFSPLSFGGIVGVQLFLVLSGFLIHYSYLRSNQSFNFGKYINSRFWRLYPPYLMVCLFFMFYKGSKYYFVDDLGIKQFVYHALLIQNIDKETFFGINPSFWSLALEFQLYLLYPLLLFIRSKVGINKTIIVLLVIWMINNICMYGFHLTSIAFHTNVTRLWIVWGLGALAAERYFFNQKTVVNNFLLMFLVILLYISKMSSLDMYFNQLIVAIISSLVILKYLFMEVKAVNYYYDFVIDLLKKIGKYSYGIYLLHQPFLVDFFEKITIFGLSKNYIGFKYLDAVIIFILILMFSRTFFVVEEKSIECGKWFYSQFTRIKTSTVI